MKWQVVGLILLGLVAAVAASVMVGWIQARKNPAGQAADANRKINIVVAQKDLAATQIVGSDAVRMETVRLQEAPKDYLTEPVQVVGRVLTVPLVNGQPFTKTCFAKEGSGLHLATVLPEGMRAVGIQLNDDSGLAGILYPGCLVDVLVTLERRSSDETRAKTVTLFQGVQVLGIAEETIVNTEGEAAKGSKTQGASKRRVVTLMLDRAQAERLQAVMKHGTVALTLRNPMDKTRIVEGQQVEAEEVGAAPSIRDWEMTILRAREPEVKKFERRAGAGG